jgi:hypothetical protein
MTSLTQAEILDLQRTKKEELEAEFHVWLQSHFDSTEDDYINSLVSLIDDEDFCKVAESWAVNTKSNKVFY